MANSKKTKTTQKRPPLKGKTFSKDYQPSGEAKSKGKQKRRLLRDILEMAFVGPKGGRMKKAAAAYLNVPEEEITVEEMLHIRQIQAAVSKQNTFAYNSIMNRVYGLPKQTTDLTTGGKELPGPQITDQQFSKLVDILNETNTGKG